MAAISQRKRILGWFFFDWASQPFHTLLLTFVFGPFFVSVAASYFMSNGLAENAADAQAQSLWSWGLALAGLVIAFGAPILGAMADVSGRRIPWIVGFSLFYVLGAFGLWWTDPGGDNLYFALILFSIGFIGAEYALVFVNAQLPSLGPAEDVGATSGSGFAFGYLGGLLSLALMLVFFMTLEGGKTIAGLSPPFGLDVDTQQDKRIVGPITALWFVIFMIPYFLWVKEPKASGGSANVGTALKTLARTIRRLPQRSSLFAYLGSSMFYRDALNGLYAFGGTYAVLVLDWQTTKVGIFGIITVIAAGFFSWLGGRFDRRFGPKPVIVVSIWGLIVVCILVAGMDKSQFFGVSLAEGSNLPDMVFLVCGILIGGLGGTVQAASRSFMVRHTDPAAPTESFALYGLSGRATSFAAPALIGFVTVVSGSARMGVLPLIFLFLIGLVLLRYVHAEGDSETWSGG